MTPLRIQGATHLLSAPPDWDDASLGACGDLHTRLDTATGHPVWTVQYAPSEADLQALLVGEPITIQIVSPFFPPIAMRTGD